MDSVVARRLYGLLLLLYPRPFRARFGDEMTDAFVDLHARTARERGAVGVAALWITATVDALVSGTGERLRGGSPGGRDENHDEGTMMRTMTTVLFYIRQALKGLRRAPGYATAFTLTLGLAIGVNSAVFSIVSGVLLRPLPFQDADRILYLKQPARGAGVDNTTFSFIEIDDYRVASATVDEFVEFGDWNFSVVGEGEPHRAVAGLVTSNYFDVLGMSASVGRALLPEDDAEGSEPVMVLTHDYWTRAFGADPEVVGRTVRLTGVTTRVVGVLEPGMHYTGSRRPEFYANYSTNAHYQGAAMRDSRQHRMTDVFARMAPGVEPSAARAELEGIADRLHAEYPDVYRAELEYGIEAVPWAEELTRQARPIFLLLMGTVGAVLLLACANVANLTLTRLIRREQELSTRSALGASGLVLRTHLTVENMILALAGAGLGLGLAVLSRDVLVSYASRFTLRAQEVGVDWTVAGATLLAGLVVAAVLAWLPGMPVNPGTAGVASAASKATHGRWRRVVQRGLVVAQLSMSFALLAGAGLLVRSLVNLYSVDPGFRTANVLTLESPAGNFGSAQGDDELFRQALHEIRTFPGVVAAAVANWAPLTGQNPIAWNVRVEGGDDQGDRSHLASFNAVSAGYFETLGMRLVAGRFLTDMDEADSDSVIVINESMADTYFEGEDAVDRRMAFSFDGQSWTSWIRIVGVVADAREYGIDRQGVHTIYRPADQAQWGPAVIVATRGEPEALATHVRDVIHGFDPERPVDQVATLADLRDRDVAPSRLNATLFGSFAVLALLIAAVGVLGVLAFSVSQRVREFGIRMALGADQGKVLRSVLTEGAALVIGALVLGGVGALVIGRLLSQLLFGVEPMDVPSLLAAAAVLGGVALAATILPALRATRVHPSEALRAE